MILPAILRNWFWFVLAGALGFGAAFLLHRAFPGSYRSTMTILLINSPHQAPFNTAAWTITWKPSKTRSMSRTNNPSSPPIASSFRRSKTSVGKPAGIKKDPLSAKKIFTKKTPMSISFSDDSVLKGVELDHHTSFGNPLSRRL